MQDGASETIYHLTFRPQQTAIIERSVKMFVCQNRFFFPGNDLVNNLKDCVLFRLEH